jgi:hypothetical protein
MKVPMPVLDESDFQQFWLQWRPMKLDQLQTAEKLDQETQYQQEGQAQKSYEV